MKKWNILVPEAEECQDYERLNQVSGNEVFVFGSWKLHSVALKTMTCEWGSPLTDTRVQWKGFSAAAETKQQQNWDQKDFFCRACWSVLTLVPVQMDFFTAANQNSDVQKVLFSSDNPVTAFSQHWWGYLFAFWQQICGQPPAHYRADSFSLWQEEVVIVALPSLLSFRKLGFSITTVADVLPLLGFSSAVKAFFSGALAESPSLKIAHKQIYNCLNAGPFRVFTFQIACSLL